MDTNNTNAPLTGQYIVSAAQLKAIGQQAAIFTCDLLGVNTELSYTRAAAEYGQFFRDMVRFGRIKPSRVGKGKTGTRWYSAADIIALRAEEEAKARLI